MKNAQVLFLASLGAGLVAALAVAAGGCGSNSPSTTPATGSSSSSGAGSSSGSGSGAGSSSGSGSGAGSSSGSGSGGGDLPCGPCTGGQACCALRTTAAPTTMCSAPTDCDDGGGILQCISPSDCPSGQKCCGASGSTQPLGTVCMTQCLGSGDLSRIVCVTALDCPDTTYTCPTNKVSDSTGALYKTCHPPVVDAGTTGEGGTAPADAGTE